VVVFAVAAVFADPKERMAIEIPVPDYTLLTTASRMNVHPFASKHSGIQVKQAEFPAFVPLSPDFEFRTNYSIYARVKHQRIG